MNPSQVGQIEQDLKRIVGEVEAAAETAGREGTAAMQNLKDKLVGALEGARERLDDVHYSVRDAARKTDRYVHEQPWPVAGVALVVGFVAGLLIGRR